MVFLVDYVTFLENDDVKVSTLQAPSDICLWAVLWPSYEGPLEGHDGCWVWRNLLPIAKEKRNQNYSILNSWDQA